MDEFLEAKEDAAWVDGVERLPPEQRAIAVATLAVDPTNGNSGGGDDAQETGTAATASPGEDPNASGDTKENGPRLGSLKGLGLRGAGNRQREAAEHEDDDDDDQFDDIGVHNEYLRGKQVSLRAIRSCVPHCVPLCFSVYVCVCSCGCRAISWSSKLYSGVIFFPWYPGMMVLKCRDMLDCRVRRMSCVSTCEAYLSGEGGVFSLCLSRKFSSSDDKRTR